MSLPWKRSEPPPIAADLGVDAIQIIQLDPDNPTSVAAATEAPIAHTSSFDLNTHLEASSDTLRTVARNQAWQGRSVVVALPAPMVSMACARIEANEDPHLVAQSRFPDLAADLMLRTIDLPENGRTMRQGRDVLLLAMSRTSVLRYVEMLHDLKFDIAAVYSPASMMVRAFAHLNRRERDADTATLYVDLDQHGTTAAIGHGRQLVLARRIDIAVGVTPSTHTPVRAQQPASVGVSGHAHDEHLMASLNRRQGAMPQSMAELSTAVERTSHQHTVDMVEELQLCLRHHRSLYEHIEVGRVVFTGTCATQQGPCRQLAQSLGIPAVVGDPLGQWDTAHTQGVIDQWHTHIRPQWAIAAGLAGTCDRSQAS